MQCLEVSGAVRPLYGSLGVKGLKPDKNNEFLQEDLRTIMIISRSIDLRMGNVSEKVVEGIKTYFIFDCF